MAQNQQIEIAFNVTPVPVNTRVNIEIRPPVGAALPFSKTTPATITTTNVLS
jgi:archaellin